MRPRLPAFYLHATFLTSCADHTAAVADESGTGATGAESTSSAASSTGGTHTSTGVDDSSGAPDTVTTSDATTGEPVCATIACGDGCCGADEVCVADVCRAPCPASVRCGDACCGAGEACVAGACAASTGACIDSFDCAADEVCDPVLQGCFPLASPTCEFASVLDEIEVALEWSFEDEQIIAVPLVGDVDGDLIPEIVVNTRYAIDELEFTGEIIAFDGVDGTESFRVQEAPADGT